MSPWWSALITHCTDRIINNRHNPSQTWVLLPKLISALVRVAWEQAEPCKSVISSINFWQVYIYKSLRLAAPQLWLLTWIKLNPEIILNIICYEPHQLRLNLSLVILIILLDSFIIMYCFDKSSLAKSWWGWGRFVRINAADTNLGWSHSHTGSNKESRLEGGRREALAI